MSEKDERLVMPRAWAVFGQNGNIRMWSTNREPVRRLAERECLPLVPLYDMTTSTKMTGSQTSSTSGGSGTANLRVTVRIQPEEGGGFIALWERMPGISAFGETPARAMLEFCTAMELAMEEFIADNAPLPSG